jgi:hypothetical protein
MQFKIPEVRTSIVSDGFTFQLNLKLLTYNHKSPMLFLEQKNKYVS